MNKLKTNNILIYLTLLTVSALSLITNISVLNIPVFADGTQHVWITRYVYENGTLPIEDITGIQPSNFNIPFSIKEPQPFLYPPIFYILSGSLTTITGSAQISVEVLNIIPIFITGLFVFLLTKDLFKNPRIALFAFILIVLSNIWSWFTVHRLVEPIIMMLASALIYSVYKYFLGKKIYGFIAVLFCVILFGIKQTTIPLISAVFLVFILQKQFKYFFLFILLFITLTFPIINYSMSTTHTILPSPTGVKVYDNFFKDAWWNQIQKEWENNLDNDANTQKLREYTFTQFKQLQLSPVNLYLGYGAIGVLNKFSLYPISGYGTEGYSSIISSTLEPFFLLLLVIFFVSLTNFKKNPKVQVKFNIFIVLLLVILFLFWYKQPVFRYYMYILLLSSIVYAYAINFLITKSSKTIKIVIIMIFCSFITMNLGNELFRDNSYLYTAMHKRLPRNNGGIEDSINFGNKIKATADSSKFIFTPMVEISYYSNKRMLWDNRLFFVDDKNKLLAYLSYYDFNYVVLPFYSGTTDKKNWYFDKGVPKDSSFAKLLNDKNHFQLIENNNTFKAYKRISK